VTISGSAADNTSVHRVYVRMSDTRFGLGPQIGGGFGSAAFVPATLDTPDAATTTWSITFTGLPVGAYNVSAYAEDAAGVATATSARPTVQVQQRPVAAPAAEPATTITGPDPVSFRASGLSVPLAGTADYTGAGGVSGLLVVARDLVTGRYLQPDGTEGGLPAYLPQPVTGPGAASTPWSVNLALPQAARWQVDVLAAGADGNLDWSAAGGRSTYFVYPGDADPTIEYNSPVDGTAVASTQISAGGRAFDDVGVTAVQLLIFSSATSGLRADGTIGTPQWVSAFITNPGGTFTNWNYLSPILPAGTWQVSARTVDSVGKTMLSWPTHTVTLTG